MRFALFHDVVSISGYTASHVREFKNIELEVIWKDVVEVKSGYHICICLKSWGRARKIVLGYAVAADRLSEPSTARIQSAVFWWHRSFWERSQNCEKGLLALSCLSVRSSHWTGFHEIWCLRMFRKSVETIQVSLKSDKNNGHFTWRPIYIFYHISHSSSIMKNVLDKIAEKIKTHILFSIIFIPIIIPFMR